MGYKHDRGPWPHGRPTIQCSTCHGSGLSPSLAFVYGASRTVLDEDQRAAAVRCTVCDGRGRMTVEHALASGQRVP